MQGYSVSEVYGADALPSNVVRGMNACHVRVPLLVDATDLRHRAFIVYTRWLVYAYYANALFYEYALIAAEDKIAGVHT